MFHFALKLPEQSTPHYYNLKNPYTTNKNDVLKIVISDKDVCEFSLAPNMSLKYYGDLINLKDKNGNNLLTNYEGLTNVIPLPSFDYYKFPKTSFNLTILNTETGIRTIIAESYNYSYDNYIICTSCPF
jgi:hypothetical protein